MESESPFVSLYNILPLVFFLPVGLKQIVQYVGSWAYIMHYLIQHLYLHVYK